MELVGRTSEVGAHHVLHLSGDVDMATLPQLHDHLVRAGALHLTTRLYIDIDGLLTLDDSGLGVLLGAAGRFRERGTDLVVVCNNERLLKRFALSGFDRAIEVVDRITPPTIE
jgi:anti-anti-sigma factor